MQLWKGGGKLRDEQRIDELLNTLGELWHKVPDWRFGQLVMNLISYIGRDPFYIEDDKMKEIIESYGRETL